MISAVLNPGSAGVSPASWQCPHELAGETPALPGLTSMRLCRLGLFAFLWVALSAVGWAQDFSSVEQIFAQHCVDCHGMKDPEGGFVLEDYGSLMKGGELGAPLVPGKSSESLLVKLIEGNFLKDGKKKIMPPGKREKLTEEEITKIKAWIDAGAN